MSQIALRGAAFVPTGNPTTSWTASIPSQVLPDDLLYLIVTSRDSTGAGTLAVTDNDTGGNAWSKIGNSTDHKLSLWFKRATSATASKTVTVSNAVGSSAGVGKAFSGGSRGATPHVNIIIESNISGNETHVGFTPDVPNAMVCAGVVNYANDNTVTSLSFATLGATTATEKTSTGGSDCGAIFGHVRQANGPAATGNLTWAQTDGTTYSITWAIVPDIEATASATLGAATVAADGTVESGPITGTLDVTLGAAMPSAQATVDVGAAASLNLGAATLLSAGAVEIAGTASLTLGAATLVADGTVESSGISGTVDVTLAADSLGADAAVAVDASSAATCAAATTSAIGDVDVVGQSDASLSPVSAAAQASVDVIAVASVTLEAMTTTATGTVALSAALTATLGEALVIGLAHVEALASASLTCGPVTLSGEGLVGEPPIVGDLNAELGAANATGSGTVDIAAALSAALEFATVAGAGSFSITGSLARSLAAATVTASGVSGSGALPATTSDIIVRSASLVACYIRTPSLGHVTMTTPEG